MVSWPMGTAQSRLNAFSCRRARAGQRFNIARTFLTIVAIADNTGNRGANHLDFDAAADTGGDHVVPMAKRIQGALRS